jgi:integrase
MVLGFCGIRPGEAFALKRGAVKNGKLFIRESATYVTGQGMVTTGTKTGKAREVAVPPPVWQELIKELPADNEALVFPGADGTMTIDNYRWVFDKGVKAMQEWAHAQRAEELAAGKLDEHGQPKTPEFPTATPYALRHTAASLYIQTGANIKVVQRQLGHETASMTLDKYGHLYSDDLDKAARMVGELIA